MPLKGSGLVPNVRTITADALGIGFVDAASRGGRGSSSPDSPEVTIDHPTVRLATRLAKEYGGVIFTGPPGTSKTFFAAETARLLTEDDEDRQWFVQFHASYQYEDFMLGIAPEDDGGFRPKPGPFVDACRKANANRPAPHVIVIDELSRADVGRVFGEALTYVERRKRELRFRLAMGDIISIPSNLFVIATMNPFDRGVDEVDAAFERRFAKITMDPDREILKEFLADAEMEDDLQEKVVRWFDRVNELAKNNPLAAVGQTYFVGASDAAALRDLWDFQLKYLVERAFRRDKTTRTEIEAMWARIVEPLPEEHSGATGGV